MFAYLVIAIELAILYSVFWYVFVREPKPFKVGADMWGTYDQGDLPFTKYDATANVYSQELHGLASRAHHNHSSIQPLGNTQRFGWVVKDEHRQNTGVTTMFSRLGRLVGALALLSLKVP